MTFQEAFNSPALKECRSRAKVALAAKDALGYSKAMFDHRNIVRDLMPDVTKAWQKSTQHNLNVAYGCINALELRT